MIKRDVTLGGILGTLRRIGWSPAAIIDIGVAHGTEGLYSVWPGTPICLIDPSPESANFMRQIAGMFPNVQTHNVGASNKAGTMSVSVDPTGVYTVFNDTKPKWAKIDVPVATCDTIVADSGLSGPFLYKLDTDAHELEIIEGSTEVLKSTDLCVLELNFFSPLQGQPGPSDLVRAMLDRGFVILDMTAVSYGTEFVGRSVDMLFTRRDSELFSLARRHSGKAPKARPNEVSV